MGKVNTTSDYFKDVFGIIEDRGTKRTLAGDEYIIQMPASAVEEVSKVAYEHVKAKYISKYGGVHNIKEARKDVGIKLSKMLGDAYDLATGTFNPNAGPSNPVTKIGTLFDPSVYSHSHIPVMIGPYDGSSIYGQGGLPASIIDKKSRGMVAQGATFKPFDKFWTTEKIDQLEAAACITGFNDKVSDAACDSYIYGGSILYPVFDVDRPSRMRADLYSQSLEKGCIKRWVSVDRWNVVFVPSFFVTAKDYLRPTTIYVPQTGLTLNTTRVAMIRPKPLPYWVMLYNLGWAPSDFAGWARAFFGYDILCQSVSVMAQQMSLLLYRLPLDGLNATIGPDRVEKLMRINEQKMAEWSSLSPKAVNMIGEVEVVNRTYSGFEDFVSVTKSNLASQCEVPEPVLWHTPNKGFSDNTTESLLKQSESMQMCQKHLERNMKPCTDALIAHVFGTDSEEWKNRDTLKMTFNKPMVSTEKDMAESGARFAASVASFCQAGLPPDVALKLTGQFFPSVKIDDELVKKAKDDFNPQATGNNIGVKSINTGHFTKPQKASVRSLK